MHQHSSLESSVNKETPFLITFQNNHGKNTFTMILIISPPVDFKGMTDSHLGV